MNAPHAYVNPDPLRRPITYLFALQWLILGLAIAVATPVALGPILGLSGPEVAALVQRTLLLSGALTLLQTLLGHRLAIQEGPAGIWTGVFLVMVSAAPSLGKSPGQLLADLQLSLIAAGLLLGLLGAFRLVGRMAALMTPLVTGTFLLLLSLQVSGPFLKGMTGVGYQGGSADPLVFRISLTTLAVVLGCAHFGKGLVRALAVLLGLAAGWLLFVICGVGGLPGPSEGTLVALPVGFAWGRPALDPGMILTGMMTGLLCLINLYGAMGAMSGVTGQRLEPRDFDRGGFVMGVGHVLSGAGSTAGIVVMTHSAALVGLMRNGCTLALRLAGGAMLVLGFFPPVAGLFAALPAPVSYAALFALFIQVAGIAVQSLSRAVQQPGAPMVAGIGLMFGVGAMLPPLDLLELLPPLARYLAGNGLLVGTMIAMLLNWLMIRRVV